MTMPGIVAYKSSQVLPTAYHIQDPMYVAFIFDGDKTYWSEPFKDKSEAENELRCMEKQISFELIKTMQDEGFHPERSVILENQYQKGLAECLFQDGISKEEEKWLSKEYEITFNEDLDKYYKERKEAEEEWDRINKNRGPMGTVLEENNG